MRFVGGSQVVEITPKARRSRSRSQLAFNVTDSGAVSIQEARLSQAEAVAALKEPIEDVGFEVTVRMAPSNRPVAQWTVSVKDLGATATLRRGALVAKLRPTEAASVRRVLIAV